MNNKYKLQSNDLIIDNFNNDYILTVSDLPKQEKPQNKLLKNGLSSLDSQELLAIFLNTDYKKETALNLAKRIFKEYGEKSIVNQKNPKQLADDLNISLGTACQITACFELGRRFFKKSKNGTVILRNAKQVFNYLKDMRNLQKEHFRGLYLNSRYKLIHDEVISVGSLTASIIHPREVFKPAIEYSAVAIIIAHNHPSGVTKPTEFDIQITKQLSKAGKILGIDILDHIIITKNKFSTIDIN